MKHKKLLMLLLCLIGIIACVSAILMLTVFRSASADSTFRSVLGLVCGIVLLLMSGLVFYLVYLLWDREPNFFLYNRKTNRNIDPSKLTFHLVNEKMTTFLALIDPQNELLWNTDLLGENDRFGFRGVYRPLVVYKMLFNLISSNDMTDWDRLALAGDHQLQLICEALEQNKEDEMVKALRFLHANYRGDRDKMREFINGNKAYIQSKMLNYVKKNLEAFYS